MLTDPWRVPATIERVIDGDTLDVTLDLGWRLYKRDHVRINGINAPEISTAAGKAAKAWLEKLLPEGTRVLVVSRSLDKYGRALADVRTSDQADVGLQLVVAGHAVPWDGRGAKPT